MLKVLNRNKDLLFVTLLVVGTICIVANPGFCADISLGESDTIAKGLEKFIKWLMGIAGAAVIIGGIVVGVQMAMGDERAPQRMKWVIGGGICILVAGAFWALLKTFFK